MAHDQAPKARRSGDPTSVGHDFAVEAPDRLWVADLSYLRCWEGLVFFAFVIDAFSRRVVGRQLAGHPERHLKRVEDRPGVAVSKRKRRSEHAGRPAMRSPGRPPVGRLEHRQRFWAAIARGLSSDDAAVQAGVSVAVGVRWFREGGGMPSVTLAAPSGRYRCASPMRRSTSRCLYRAAGRCGAS
jgi:hypothetical protein